MLVEVVVGSVEVVVVSSGGDAPAVADVQSHRAAVSDSSRASVDFRLQLRSAFCFGRGDRCGPRLASFAPSENERSDDRDEQNKPDDFTAVHLAACARTLTERSTRS